MVVRQIAGNMNIWQVQDWVKTEFHISVLTLILNRTENRTRHARGPVQSSSPLFIFVRMEKTVTEMVTDCLLMIKMSIFA